MKAPQELVMAAGTALERYLAANNQWDRDCAKREYDRHQAEIRRIENAGKVQKVGRASHRIPLGGMSARDLLW